ncbi:MAG: CDP-glucose 4,6-dehydratase, partial [Vicinamibacteraceae bacterium]
VEAAELALDPTLAADTLGWRARVSVNEMIDQTVDWWRVYHAGEHVRSTMIGQIASYEARLHQ